MADQNTETLKIQLHVYDEDISVKIDRKEEEYYRAAAKLITDRYNVYAQKYKGNNSDHKVALMTLIDIALMYKKECATNNAAPFVDILSELTAEIDNAIEKTE